MSDWRAALLVLALLAPLPAFANENVRILSDHWTQGDERGYGEFITAIGESGCRTVDSCLHNPANPFRASDAPGASFRSDCADLPYYLRFYYAWKRGLPFSYVRDVSPRGRSRDIRYSPKGNQVESRRDVLSGDRAMDVLNSIRDDISSATYRIHPELEDPENDLYSPMLSPRGIHPGTVIYDPNGHLAIVWRIEADGRIRYIDAHPDNSLTRGFYDLRFVRSSPGMGAGFKNWRPVRLVGAATAGDGALTGGHVVLARNSEIADFALTQFFGTGPRPDDSDWRGGAFVLGGQVMDYYDYVRASLGGGELHFDPLREVADMVTPTAPIWVIAPTRSLWRWRPGLQVSPSPTACPSISMAPKATGRLIPRRHATPGSRPPSRNCATTPSGFSHCGGHAIRAWSMRATIWPATCWRSMTAPHRSAASAISAATDRMCNSAMRKRDGGCSPFPSIPINVWSGAGARKAQSSPPAATARSSAAGMTQSRTCATRSTAPMKRGWISRLSELEARAPGSGPAAPPDTDTRAYLLAAHRSQ